MNAGGPSNCEVVVSQGTNLVQDATGCTGLGVSDITAQDPLLGPLQNNGGKTSTQALGAGIYLALAFAGTNRRRYATLRSWRFEPALFGRLLRFGLPTGLQAFAEILAFALFMIIVGRIGTAELAASSLAFNLNMIVFFPMLGLGIAVSTLVARYLGSEEPALAERSVWSAFWMSLGYMAACGGAYLMVPRLLLGPYAGGADPATFGRVQELAVVLLRFVALYSIFDMMNVIFAAGLRGAGDTRYPMMTTLVLAWAAMLIPAGAACLVHALVPGWFSDTCRPETARPAASNVA